MRRSQRLSGAAKRRPLIDTITISDSEDDDVPLPRPQPRNDDSSDVECLTPIPTPTPSRGKSPNSRLVSSSQPNPRSPSADRRRSSQDSGKRVASSQPVILDNRNDNPRGPRANHDTNPSSASDDAPMVTENQNLEHDHPYAADDEDQVVNRGRSSRNRLSSSSDSSQACGEEGRGSDSASSSSSSSVVIRPPRRVPVIDADLSGSGNETTSKPTESSAGQTPTGTPGHRPPRHLPNRDQESEIRSAARARRLVLDRIVGAVKIDSRVEFVVKWMNVDQLERISLAELRVLFPQQVLAYMIDRIKWNSA